MENDLDDGELQRDSHMRTNLFNKQVVTIGGGTGPFAVLSASSAINVALPPSSRCPIAVAVHAD